MSARTRRLHECNLIAHNQPLRPKRQYASLVEAARAVPDQRALREGRIRPYQCRVCGFWHTGRVKPARVGALGVLNG